METYKHVITDEIINAANKKSEEEIKKLLDSDVSVLLEDKDGNIEVMIEKIKLKELL